MEDGMSRLARALAGSGLFSHTNRLLDEPRSPEPAPRNRLLSRSASEDDVQFGFNPIDELRRTVNTQSYTPEQAAQNRQNSLYELLSVIPGPGNAISAHDAYTGIGDAYDAFKAGDHKGGALASALAGLSGAGAVFGLPFGKFAKGAADAGKRTLFSGAGSMYGGPRSMRGGTVYLPNPIDPEKLAAVKAEMLERGAPTIRILDNGDHYIALEGSHRLSAAAELGITPNYVILQQDDMVPTKSLDFDLYGLGDNSELSAGEIAGEIMGTQNPHLIVESGGGFRR